MDKIKTLFKQYPLALLLALSWLILSGWGLVNFCLQPSEYSEIHTTGAMLTGDTTLIGSFFEGPGGTSSTSSVSSVLNRKSLPVPASYPKSDPEGAQDSPLFHRSAAYSPEREASDLSGILPDQELYPESDPGSEPLPEEAAEPEPEYTPFASVPRTPSEPRHPLYDDVGATALDTPADYITVEDDYFDHALFLGDSRIEGMSMASGLNNADYLYLRGVGIGYMSVLDLFYVSGGRFVQEDAQLTSVLQKND